jgi:hypothetical protein
MPRISLNGASEAATRFFRREAGIVMPVAFATFGLGMLLVTLAAPPPGEDGQLQHGPWMLAMIPALLAAVIGQLAISAMVLRPGISVAEALRDAFGRLPRALIVILLMVAAGMVGLLAISLVLGIIAYATAAGDVSLWTVATLLLFVAFVWFSARLLLVWPMVADRSEGAVRTFRAAWALSKGSAGRFFGALLLFSLVYVVVTGAVQLVFGSLFLLLGRAIGADAAAVFLAAIVVALAASALLALWAVFVTYLYRAAAGSTTGS